MSAHRLDEVVFLHSGVADERSWPGAGVAYRRSGLVDPIDEVLSVLDDHRLPAAVLVGHSLGGSFAVGAALDHPERVRALFLIAPAVSGAPMPATLPPEVQELSAKIDAADEAGDIDEVNRLEAHLWLDGPLEAEGRVSGEARTLFLAMNGAALRAPEPAPEREREPQWPRLGSLDIPTRIIIGDLDVPHMVERAQVMATTLPNATIRVMKGVAHMPPLEQPAALLAELDDFVSTLHAT